ncbi:MAG TPA: TraR/DksA C4-type zinc finger protein [Bryobacteraceae bacterium]|jgi:DnaK suppressor protein
MSRAQVNPELWNALQSKAEECRRALSSARQELGVETTAPVAQRQFAAERMDLYSRTLRQVEAALGRVESGAYGICLRCEDEIGQRRLEALPWAPFCVECQHGADLLHDRIRIYAHEGRRAA